MEEFQAGDSTDSSAKQDSGAQALDETDSFHLIRSGTVTSKPTQGQGTVPVVTLKKNPFQYSPPSYGNSVKTIKVESRRAQVEAVLEMINRAKQDNTPRGLVLNQSVVTGKNSTKADEMVNVKKVLGSGNSAGDVVVVEDSGTGKDYAKKVIMLSQFNKDEILAWIHLSEAGKAPELYHFELKDNMVITSMEIMAGKTLQEVIDSGKLTDPLLARSFSLLVLRDLLTAFDCLKQGGFTHGDMHGGNVMVLPSMDIKLFDFGLARSMLLANMDHSQRMKADIVGILRMFCAAYTSGLDFEDYAAAQKALQSNKFREISQYMQHVPEHIRQELFGILASVFDSVRSARQEKYADTQNMAREVEAMLPRGEELDELKRRLAVILFPDRYRSPFHGPEFTMESDNNDECDGNPLLDDPNLADLATLVDLKSFGNMALF